MLKCHGFPALPSDGGKQESVLPNMSKPFVRRRKPASMRRAKRERGVHFVLFDSPHLLKWIQHRSYMPDDHIPWDRSLRTAVVGVVPVIA